MAKTLAKFLSPLDAAFLYVEKPRETMHIGSVMVYEGRIEREQLERILLDRLHLVPRYRERAVFPPWNASTPMWMSDPDFDIKNHVEVVELEPPVDDRALARAAARVYAGMLDRRHPLWKLIILHGLPDDHTAVVWKVHHAMVDGVSGIDLTMALHDFRPDAEPPAPPAEKWQPPPIPDQLTLLQQAVEHTHDADHAQHDRELLRLPASRRHGGARDRSQPNAARDGADDDAADGLDAVEPAGVGRARLRLGRALVERSARRQGRARRHRQRPGARDARRRARPLPALAEVLDREGRAARDVSGQHAPHRAARPARQPGIGAHRSSLRRHRGSDRAVPRRAWRDGSAQGGARGGIAARLHPLRRLDPARDAGLRRLLLGAAAALQHGLDQRPRARRSRSISAAAACSRSCRSASSRATSDCSSRSSATSGA